MILRGTDFGHVINASGARNFDGHGYPLHRLFRPFGLNWRGSTFVAKTTTFEFRDGNMPLRPDGVTPWELFPRCIRVNPLIGSALNAVGLSGPGAGVLFDRMGWEKRQKPFFLSFMSVAKTAADRLEELAKFVAKSKPRLSKFLARVGLIINASCPNVGLDPATLLDELSKMLEVAGDLRVPLVLKFSATIPAAAIASVGNHPLCDAVILSNTIPWGKLPWWINWTQQFPFSVGSPLAHLGGGGLSGAPLLPVVIERVHELRVAGFEKPIIAGGGVLCGRDADYLIAVGADAISLGTIAIVRPWRVQKTIRQINRRFRLLKEFGVR